jgi:hypothetical protein
VSENPIRSRARVLLSQPLAQDLKGLAKTQDSPARVRRSKPTAATK